MTWLLAIAGFFAVVLVAGTLLALIWLGGTYLYDRASRR